MVNTLDSPLETARQPILMEGERLRLSDGKRLREMVFCEFVVHGR
jgi:hypothetical protein